jgi:FkbM family methyltransferase
MSDEVDQNTKNFQQRAEAAEAALREERRLSQQLRHQLFDLRNHLEASRWIKIGRQLGLTKLAPIIDQLKDKFLVGESDLSGFSGVSAPASGFAPGVFTMEATLQHLVAKGFRPKVILDIGAAKGYWSEFAHYFYPDAAFYMIDPLLESESRLQQLCATKPNFSYVLCAAGDVDGEISMSISADLDGSSLFSFNVNGTTDAPERIVPVYAIDSLLSSGKIAPPQFVKIDVQGYELNVLKGGQKLLETTEVFILEVSIFKFLPDMPVVHQVVDYMVQHNYVLYDIAGYLRRPYENDLGQLDLVFVRQDSPLYASTRWH